MSQPTIWMQLLGMLGAMVGGTGGFSDWVTGLSPNIE